MPLAGRGLDTHRTWESLALGCIPITVVDPLTPLYNHLPVITVSDVSELTPKNLEEWYDVLHSDEALAGYEWNRVTGFWWLQHIVLDSRRKSEYLEAALGMVYA